MSYDIVRNGLTNILQLQGLTESLEAVDFRDASDAEYENTFILQCKDGEADDANEQQAAFLYDNQVWEVQIAYNQSSENSNEQLNAIHRKKDTLLSELDDPVNWRSFCTLLRYKSWTIETRPNYYVLRIELKIKDLLTY